MGLCDQLPPIFDLRRHATRGVAGTSIFRQKTCLIAIGLAVRKLLVALGGSQESEPVRVLPNGATARMLSCRA